MHTPIGEILSSNGETLLKMFDATISFHTRPLAKHCHTQFEISLVISGEGLYSVSDTVHAIQVGDVFVFSSNESHYITQVTSAPLHMLTLQFEPLLLFGSSFDSLSNNSSNLCFMHNDDFKNRIPSERSQHLQNVLLQMKEELSMHQQEYALIVKSLLNFLLVDLIREHNFLDQSHPFKRSNVHAIRNAVNYINAHLSDPITLADVANAAHISPSYLSSLFKDFFGISLWRHIVAKRVEKATTMLMDENNSYTILEIALSCGFNNTSNFNRAFRNHLGVSPSEYRCSGHQQP